jgi:hypothetical protein
LAHLQVGDDRWIALALAKTLLTRASSARKSAIGFETSGTERPPDDVDSGSHDGQHPDQQYARASTTDVADERKTESDEDKPAQHNPMGLQAQSEASADLFPWPAGEDHHHSDAKLLQRPQHDATSIADSAC